MKKTYKSVGCQKYNLVETILHQMALHTKNMVCFCVFFVNAFIFRLNIAKMN